MSTQCVCELSYSSTILCSIFQWFSETHSCQKSKICIVALNISHAVAIVLYELLSDEYEYREVANKEENRAVVNYFGEIAKEVYNKDEKSKMRTALTVVKRVLSRAILQKREAHTMCGLLSRVKKKL